MRTLKKVLALSMVFAMAFSMMAGAAFNDQDQIDASLVEDIQLLTALEVFQGDEKGDFNPTANVTRAQAAKMIYVLKNNGQDDEAAAFKGQSVYSDVPSGHWAEGYINYCTNLGIMSGWTEGSVRKFDPNGNVTGLELTKMLLCMIGYRADIQGYTGNGWQTNVLRDGATSAVTTNYLPTIYSAAPRQWTARLMANAINAPYISYSRGEVVQGSAVRPDMSYGEQYLGLVTVEGYLQNAGKVSLPNGIAGSLSIDDDGDTITVRVNDENLESDRVAKKDMTGGSAMSFKTTVDPSLLGQHVKVYFKKATTTTNQYKVYSVLPTGKSKVYETTLADVTTGQNDNGETIKIAGYNGGSAKTYAGHAVTGSSDKLSGATVDRDKDVAYQDIKLIKNLKTIETVESLKKNTADNTASDKKGSFKNFGAFSGNSNETIRFVDQDNDGIIDLAFTNVVDYAVVGSHNASKNSIRFEKADGVAVKLVGDPVETVNSEATYKKVNFVNDVAEGDVVSVTLNRTNGTDTWDIAKVEPITGSVSGYGTNDGATKYTSVVLNGETVKFAKKMMENYGVTTSTDTHIVNDTTFYTDGKFIVYSKGGDSVASVGNLAYIIARDKYSSFEKETAFVKVLLSDGTQGQYEVAATYKSDKPNFAYDGTLTKTTSDLSGGVDYSLLEPGKVMSYSISNNKITLNELKSDKPNTNGIEFGKGTQSYDNSKKLYETGNGKLKMSEDAYFFVKSTNSDNEEKYSVVKASEIGKNLQSKTEKTYATKKSSDGINYVVFGTLDLEGSAVATAAKYAFVKSAASYAVVDGDHVAQMTVVLPSGEESVIKKTFTNVAGANDEIKLWNGYRNKLVTYDLDAEGNVEGLKPVTQSTAGEINKEKWTKVIITGWNGSSAMVIANATAHAGGDDDGKYLVNEQPDAVLLNVASDVKAHIVDASDTNYSLTDGSVEKTAKNDAGTAYVGYSAFVYVQDVNGQDTITDIYSADGGASLAKMFPAD